MDSPLHATGAPKPDWRIAFAVFGALALFVYLLYRDMHQSVVGKEYPAADEERWLAGALRERFEWSSLPQSSVNRAWVNGFQDHVHLYRVRLGPEEFAGLRRAVLATQGENITVDDRDDFALCPFGFATASPRGPEGMRLPSWWDPRSLQNFDALLWDSRDWGYWFAYDPGPQILFLMIHDT
jgi:hypothetical protein